MVTMDFAAGLWRLADPKVSLASFAALFLGAAAAGASGGLDWGWLALTVAGIFAIEVAKNASGEIIDWDSGVDQAVAAQDRSPFSGGKRVLVDGLLDRRMTRLIAAAAYLAGICCGLAIAQWREPRVLWLGVAGVALAYFYHAPPLRLAYRGFGELAVAVCYGPLIALGTFLVQHGRCDPVLAGTSGALGLLVAAFLVANEFPDFRADRAGGKRNLVVRLGRPRAARLFALITLAACTLTVAVAWQARTAWPLGGLLAVPASAWAARRLATSPEVTARIVPAQAASLAAFLAYALGAGGLSIWLGTG